MVLDNTEVVMNIFILDYNTKLAAEYHTDKHVVKMIVETAQLLSTAHRILDSGLLSSEMENGLYRSTHQNHPCAVWTRQASDNYRWTYNLLVDLLSEYTHRYGRVHKTSELLKYLVNIPINITVQPMTPFAQAMPDEYKNADAILAYRNYYIGAKKDLIRYTKREKPKWLEEVTV
jgi:hypothetical protein